MELPVWSVLTHKIILVLALTAAVVVVAAAGGGGGGGNHYNIETDKLSLLGFKSQITVDPHGILNSWNESLHVCEWTGITCGRRHRRVTKLELNSYDLKGSISSHVGNLSFLRTLDLHNNTLTRQIPPQIGHLFRLTELILTDNSLSGPIPHNISRCSSLQNVTLARNNLTGKVPVEIGLLSKLKALDLSTNNLVGEIPESIGNLSSLERFSLSINNLHGSIPSSFGLLKSLSVFLLGEAGLSGEIPHSMFTNLSSITRFGVTANQLQGSLPSDLGHKLPNLEYLQLSDNQFGGPIPTSFSNASNLLYFEVAKNNFTGKVPSFARSSNLQYLLLQLNNLGSRENEDLNFLSSLTNCTHLQALGISDNDFRMVMPKSIGNISTELVLFDMGYNRIHGSIPTEIGNLINLELLSFDHAQLTGAIPSSIGKLQKLNDIYLNNNKLSGIVPSSLGNLTQLSRLYLQSNNLQGSIPSSLGECKRLTLMDLSQNNLSGPIPTQLIGLSSFSIALDLSSNSLTGPVPTEVDHLVNLPSLDLHDNKLSGEIPTTLGGCTVLVYLYLNGNSLQGDIPSSLASLRGIEQIDLSSNNLSGTIPRYLQTFHFLEILNLSFNDFEGEVPIQGVFSNVTALSVVGNTRLCGGVLQLNLPKCSTNPHKKHRLSHKAMIIIVCVACGLVALVLAMYLLVLCVLRKRRKSPNLGFTFGIPLLKVSYGDLFKATDGFSSENLIGAGSFGSVYKGILNQQEAQVVAVKVLKLETSRASKSFIAECNALKRMKHRNLVRIITACSSIDFQGNDFKALVYEFMVNGSLEEWLHPTHSASSGEEYKHLSLTERVNISLDVANALDYLHNQLHVPIVHCDLKPSNVLLDRDMNAHLGDFGLVRFLPDASHPFSSEQISSLGIRGSIGYTAPEYGMGSEVSTLGDVYSYGILLLEMFTRKRPTDMIFRDGLNLHNFALTGLSSGVEEIVDAILLQTEDESSINTTHNKINGAQSQCIHDCLISVINIGLACSAELQRERMDIADVVSELCHIKDKLLGKPYIGSIKSRLNREASGSLGGALGVGGHGQQFSRSDD
ncbi:probable LRR receptor-like serine/threonine-protein kinase At3g47570 [Ziziphus jujuba]|uniref:Probable LRR receptor-like serine/threonine-protein kinase At3g47570 n=1 Tax=Ziziphus jujuba TaxID=326968 RepID=A0ABM3IEJ1_ZIZJJ|nr:probable LRR receptor-like serine/threonine-protein kinase At3g47570 [Ziziphus jujuba]